MAERLVQKVPHGHWKTTTLITALDHRGVRCAMNVDVFAAFCREVLAPTLRPGDLVVMDNLSSHNAASVREAIKSVGAELRFLPPYSPDFNPIEMAFAKIKQALRSIACRTVQALWNSLQSVLDRITPSNAGGLFKHCDYTLQME